MGTLNRRNGVESQGMLDAKLREVYQNTEFVVDGPGGQITLRVGETNQEIDTLLKSHGASKCAYITAWNPHSVRLEVGKNSRRQAELVEEVRHLGHTFLVGRGVAENKEWAPEESVLVIGIDRSPALELGRTFGQNAIVFKEVNRAAELLFCS